MEDITEEMLTSLRQELLKFTDDMYDENETKYNSEQLEYFRIRQAIVSLRREIDNIKEVKDTKNIIMHLIRFKDILSELHRENEIRILKTKLKLLEGKK